MTGGASHISASATRSASSDTSAPAQHPWLKVHTGPLATRVAQTDPDPFVKFKLPPLDGFLACRKVLTLAGDAPLIDHIQAHYPDVALGEWQQRFALGHVRDQSGQRLAPEQHVRTPFELHYYRPFSESPIPVREQILFQDEDLVVVDKPHFLPVHPAGKYLKETLVARVIERLGNPELSPLHRLDRLTAGLVLFSTRAATRACYQNLFRDRAIDKQYVALAPALPALTFPMRRQSCLQRHTDGFRNVETEGAINADTWIDVIDRGSAHWRYALRPRTGQMHQLRVHMSALGAPILNDPWYPDAQPTAPDDHQQPLQLLAQSLSFTDPLSGHLRLFRSQIELGKLLPNMSA